MAQSIGTVYIEVAPSGKDFGKKLEGDLTGGMDKAAKTGGTNMLAKLGGTFGKIGKLGLGAVGTIAGGITGLAAKGGFERALNIENAQAKLKGLGHDAGSVSEIMNNALASVKGTAFGLGDAATVAASLSAAGVASGEQMTKVLKTVADTAQISGRSLTDIGTIFGSVAARGKLQGDDMLQLMSSGVPVLQMLAKHLNTTSEDVSDMVSKGKIDFQTFADAMQEGLGGAALAAGDTFSGALANVKAALSRLGEGPGTIALESLRKTFNAAIPAIDAVSNQLTPLVEQLNGQVTPYVDKATQAIDKLAKGLANGSVTIQGIAGQAASLAGAFALFAGAGGNIDTITGVLGTLGKAGDKGLAQFTARVKQLPGQLETSLAGLQQFGMYFNTDLRDALAVDGDPFANALNRIQQGSGRLTAPLQQLGGKIASTDIGQSVAGMADRFTTGFGKLTSTVDMNVRAFGVKLTSGMSGVVSNLGGDKLASGFASVVDKAKTAIAPALGGLGDVFGGIGDIVGPQVQAGLGKIGSLFGTFFSPGNFIKYMGVAGIIAALVAGIGLLDQSMGGQLASMIATISQQVPGWLTQIGTAVTGALPGIIVQGAGILTMLMNAITANAPQLMTTATLIITTLVNGLAAQLPTLIPAALSMVMALVNGLASNAGTILSSGMNLLLGLVQGLMNALPNLIAQAPTIIGNLADSVAANLPNIVQTGVQILVTLAQGLASAIPQLIAQIPAIIGRLKDAFTSVDWGSVGMNIIKGIASGLSGAAKALADAASKAAGDALNWVKDKLGIHSPSRVFRDQVGVMMGRGMAEGVTDSQTYVTRAFDKVIDGLTFATLATPTIAAPTPTATATNLVNQTADTTRAASRNTNVQVSIDASGTDPDVLFAMFGARTEAAVNAWG